MTKATFLLLLIALAPLFSFAQSTPQIPAGDFPSVTTPGNTHPEVVPDLNVQLIWLLAAAPDGQDSQVTTAARREYLRAALGNVGAQNQEKLSTMLRDFRSRHDAFAAEYNALIPSINRDDVWVEYRNFRVKVNDLVAETIRAINDTFPDSASQFHTTLEECKQNVSQTVYRSSVDTNYASNPRAAATGFAMIQGMVSNLPAHSEGQSSTPSATVATAVVVGMVPGCRGKVFPLVMSAAGDVAVTGPKMLPWEYVNFQHTAKIGGIHDMAGIMVNCEMPEPR